MSSRKIGLDWAAVLTVILFWGIVQEDSCGLCGDIKNFCLMRGLGINNKFHFRCNYN